MIEEIISGWPPNLQQCGYVVIPVALSVLAAGLLLFFLFYIRCQKKLLGIKESTSQLLEREKQASALASGRLEEVQRQNAEYRENIEDLTHINETLSKRLADSMARAEEQGRAAQAEMERLVGLRESLVTEFETLVSRHFHKQQQQFGESSQERLTHILSPLKHQLGEFRTRIDEIHKNDIAQTHQMMGQVQQLQEQAQKIGGDALQLAQALRGSSKLRGNWGEWVLHRLLEQSGLREGREFYTQVSHVDDQGRRQQPDVIVQLPGDRQIVVDAKLSLTAYEAWSRTETTDEATYLKRHIDSVRQHFKDLGKKRYDELSAVNSLDHVIMFVPIETAFVVAIEADPQLLAEANSCRVVLAGPSTLVAILQTVQSLWQRERQDRNVEQIVLEAGKLHDQFALVVESMEAVGSALAKAQCAHEQALSRLSRGKGNVLKRVDRLRELGAKTRRNLPDQLLEESESPL